MHITDCKTEVLTFRRWTRKKYAVSNSLKGLVRKGTYPDATGKTTDYQPCWLSDIRIYRKTDHLTFFTDISNVFDTRYMDYGGIVQPGRWITAEVILDLDYLKRN
jgi:hypothetical protein